MAESVPMRAKSIVYYYAAIFAWMAMGYPVLSAFAQTPNLATVARLTSVSCCQACAVGLAIMATLHTKQYQRYWAALEAVYIYGFITIFVLFVHFMPLGGSSELFSQCLFHYLLPVFLGGPLVYTLLGASILLPTYAMLEMSNQWRGHGATSPLYCALRAAWVAVVPMLAAIVVHLSYLKDEHAGEELMRMAMEAVGWEGGGEEGKAQGEVLEEGDGYVRGEENGGTDEDAGMPRVEVMTRQTACMESAACGSLRRRRRRRTGDAGQTAQQQQQQQQEQQQGQPRPRRAPLLVQVLAVFAVCERWVYRAAGVLEPKVLLLAMCLPLALGAFVRQTAHYVAGPEDCPTQVKPMETLIAMTACFMLGTLEPQAVLSRQLGTVQALLYDLMPAHVAHALLKSELGRRAAQCRAAVSQAVPHVNNHLASGAPLRTSLEVVAADVAAVAVAAVVQPAAGAHVELHGSRRSSSCGSDLALHVNEALGKQLKRGGVGAANTGDQGPEAYGLPSTGCSAHRGIPSAQLTYSGDGDVPRMCAPVAVNRSEGLSRAAAGVGIGDSDALRQADVAQGEQWVLDLRESPLVSPGVWPSGTGRQQPQPPQQQQQEQQWTPQLSAGIPAVDLSTPEDGYRGQQASGARAAPGKRGVRTEIAGSGGQALCQVAHSQPPSCHSSTPRLLTTAHATASVHGSSGTNTFLQLPAFGSPHRLDVGEQYDTCSYATSYEPDGPMQSAGTSGGAVHRRRGSYGTVPSEMSPRGPLGVAQRDTVAPHGRSRGWGGMAGGLGATARSLMQGVGLGELAGAAVGADNSIRHQVTGTAEGTHEEEPDSRPSSVAWDRQEAAEGEADSEDDLEKFLLTRRPAGDGRSFTSGGMGELDGRRARGRAARLLAATRSERGGALPPDRPRFDLPDLARTLRAKSSLSFSMLSDMRRSWLAATVGQGLGPSPSASGQQFGHTPWGSPVGTSPCAGGAPGAGMASPTATHAGLGGQGGAGSAAGSRPPSAVLSSSLAYAEWHEQVTLLFCDIVGFTDMSNRLPAGAVLEVLNQLYTVFDSLTARLQVYKVDTVGDCFIAATGLIKADPQHADTMLHFARAMRAEAAKVTVPGYGPIRVRIGVHSGRVISGVVGTIRKKYSIFGDTANTASRMESLSEPGQIHVSSATYDLVSRRAAADWQCRGEIEVKGKGRMVTYWYKYKAVPPAACPAAAAAAGPPPRDATPAAPAPGTAATASAAMAEAEGGPPSPCSPCSSLRSAGSSFTEAALFCSSP